MENKMAQLKNSQSVELNENDIIAILQEHFINQGVYFNTAYLNIGHKPCGTFEEYGTPTPILKSITLSN
jgi:hypothetical protein